jgi:hypothetical protein
MLRFETGFGIRDEFLISLAFDALVEYESAASFFIFLIVDR